MPQWSSAADVHARVTYADPFSGTSAPTLTEVESWLDELEAEVLVRLRAAGLSTTVTDQTSQRLIRGRVVDGALARVLRAWGVQGQPDLLEEAATLQVRWDEFLARVDERPTEFGQYVDTSGQLAEANRIVRSHVTDPGGYDGGAVITTGWVP